MFMSLFIICCCDCTADFDGCGFLPNDAANFESSGTKIPLSNLETI